MWPVAWQHCLTDRLRQRPHPPSVGSGQEGSFHGNRSHLYRKALDSVLGAVRMRAYVVFKRRRAVAEERNMQRRVVRAEVCTSEYARPPCSICVNLWVCVQVLQTTRGIRPQQSRIVGETGYNVASLECRTPGYAKLWLNTPTQLHQVSWQPPHKKPHWPAYQQFRYNPQKTHVGCEITANMKRW